MTPMNTIVISTINHRIQHPVCFPHENLPTSAMAPPGTLLGGGRGARLRNLHAALGGQIPIRDSWDWCGISDRNLGSINGNNGNFRIINQ